jgi:hypothetical protein
MFKDLDNDPSKCLAQLFAMERKGPDYFSKERVIEHCKKVDPETDWDKLSVESPTIANEVLARVAHLVFRLDPNSRFDKPLMVAFEKAGLDHNNVAHWRLLLTDFCIAHYYPRRKGRGAPKLWRPEDYCRLLRDEARVRRDHPTFSNEDVYRTIIKRGAYKQRKSGKPLGAGRIKSALREARDPKCNMHLAANISNVISQIRSERERTAIGWSSDVEAEVTRLCIKKYCEVVVDGTGFGLGPLET